MHVEIVKKNESYSILNAEDSLMYELKDHLTFQAPNAQWHPAFKKGYWDGNISLLNADRTIYTGLVDQIKKFCNANNYTFSLKGFSPDLEYNPNELKKEVLDWSPTRFDKGKRVPLTPHKEQIHALWVALCTRRCIIESATAAGKSFIIWTLIRKLLPGKRILVIVPLVDLATQLKDDLEEYYPNWKPELDVLYHGEELTEAPIVISTWQSIIKKPASYFEQFDVLIEDEVHKGDAKSTAEIVSNCVNAEYRVGLTGSLKDSKTHRLTLRGLFGANFTISTASDNIKKGISAPVKIKVLKKRWKKVAFVDEEDNNLTGTLRYRAELNHLENLPERNELIYNISAACKGTHVVLFKSIEHGNLLYEEYKKVNPNTFLIHSKVKREKREQIKKFAKANPTLNICIIASIGTFATGINIPNIIMVILACPLKGTNIILKQAIGRGLRLKDDGGHFTFIDLLDCIGPKSTVERQGNSRIQAYIKEEHPYSIINL